MDTANRLKTYRKDNNLEQEDLARLLGTTQQTVSNWEKGTAPRADAMRRINALLITHPTDSPTSPVKTLWPTPRVEGARDAEGGFAQQVVEIAKGFHPCHAVVKQNYPGVPIVIDYLSEKVCTEFRYITAPIFPQMNFYRLLTARQVLLRQGTPRATYMLFLIAPNGEALRTQLMNQIYGAAALHEIGVLIVKDAQEAAEYLVGLEQGNLPEWEDFS